MMHLGDKTKDSEVYKIFQKEIETEIIKGEIVRAKFLAGIFFLFGINFTLFPIFGRKVFVSAFGENFNPLYPPIYFFSIAIYFFINSRVFNVWFARNRPIPIIPRYINAFIETSIPSISILYIGHIREPAVYVMLTPPSFVYFIFIIASALQLNFRICVFTGFVAASEYLTLTFYLLNRSQGYDLIPFISTIQSHIGKTIFLFLAGVLVGYVTSQIERRLLNSFALLEERNRVTNLFGQHVSPAVVEKLLTQSEFTSEIRHVCMMFFDIRNFTNFSESKHPEDVVNYLNTIFDFSIDIINRHGGIINKFLGDGFMAVFGAPISSGDDIQNAVKASLEIIEKVKMEIDNKNIPQTNIGIGLHAGDAVTGNVGSSKRKEYTIIGDVVNLASRIEQLNKNYSSQLLISEDVWSKLSGYSGESLGEVLVKGREKPVRIYKLA